MAVDMEIWLYSFSKRNKSTKVTTQSGALLDAQIKDICSVENPTLLLEFDPTEYNYCYIPIWRRYYFISGWKYVVGVWEVSLTEDYLASYKDEILGSSALIAYAHGSTASMVDKRIPVTSEVTASTKTSAAISGVNWLTGGLGSPILSITGKGSNGVYYVTYTDVMELLDGVDQWFVDNVADFFDAIKQLIYGGSAANCIKDALSLCWIPTAFINTEDLYLGNYPAKDSGGNNITGKRVVPIESHSCNISIPWRYDDWRRSEPYTEIRLFLPLVGNVSISAEAAKNDSSLDITYAFNNTSGDINIIVKGHTTGVVLNTSTTSGACALHIGSSNTNVGKITASVGGCIAAIAAGAATILTGGAAAPAILGIGGGVAAAAAGTLQGLGGYTDGSGGLGGSSAIALGTNVECQVITRNLSDQQLNLSIRMGKPLFKNTKIGNYSGYVQTEGFQFESNRASSAEKDVINQLLDSGIYVE